MRDERTPGRMLASTCDMLLFCTHTAGTWIQDSVYATREQSSVFAALSSGDQSEVHPSGASGPGRSGHGASEIFRCALRVRPLFASCAS